MIIRSEVRGREVFSPMITKVIITMIVVIGIRLSKKAEKVCDVVSVFFPFMRQIRIWIIKKLRILLVTVKMARLRKYRG